MPGCVNAAAARASRRSRPLPSSSPEGGSTLSATWRPRVRSSAAYTTPIPPLPSSERMVYLPSTSPAQGIAPARGSSGVASGVESVSGGRAPSLPPLRRTLRCAADALAGGMAPAATVGRKPASGA